MLLCEKHTSKLEDIKISLPDLGAVARQYQVFLNVLCLLHCVPLYVCRLCINFQLSVLLTQPAGTVIVYIDKWQ